ncbi:MAG: histidinol-phosphate transaminase [Bacteroidetes bacterium]|nr:histidinol-phosphate transaminase [Bacteroidota bacterium]MBU1677950.1 histidinol-phosphate transaminase [Bacteroidota bacterium]MBU2506968.1 histidinol-phosphate transaminase [Bacteroidota bacterium]
MIDNLVRENIKRLKPYTSARESFEKGILLDANENPFGAVIESDLELNRYPDPKQKEVRTRLGEVLGVASENLFFGVGSDEIIDLLIRIFCTPQKDEVMILEPTYGMYKVACDINDVKTSHVMLDENFQIDFNAIRNAWNENTKLIFLCNPNNPTGNLIDPHDILQLCSKYNSIIIVDEAYIDFANGCSLKDEVGKINNLVILRTFSKAWGLAGIRAGYCIANSEIISYLFKIKAPYNLNKLTSKTILDALDNYSTMQQNVVLINAERIRLISELQNLTGIIKICTSHANFVLVKFENAEKVFNYLISKNVIIRNRSNMPGLQDCLRITIGTKEENDFLLIKLREIL